MRNKPLVVLDTGVIVASLAIRSPVHKVIDRYLREDYDLAVSTEVLLEYEELLLRKYPAHIAIPFLESLVKRHNTLLVTPNYKWRLITADPDDDKFVDCAVCANADALVTEGRHFNVLKTVSLPQINVLNIAEFLAVF